MIPFGSGLEIISPHGSFLDGRGANQTSQFGEDGLIDACFRKFWLENKWCFEVGAGDGFNFSNTARLREKNWHAVLIEADDEQFARLKGIQSERIFTVHQRIGRSSLDAILKEHKAPKSIDLGVIDIDGQDYWAWEGMRAFRPRIMLVEFDYGSNEKPDWVPEPGNEGQASLAAILRLGRDKGYTPLATTICNVVFCRNDLLEN